MKIAFESELMENQKHAVVMAPDRAFEVLQSKDGDALFFSIGTDKNSRFYLTREVTKTATGWNRIDLSGALSSQHGGAEVTAKTFSVAQNAQTLAIDLALVLTVGGVDFLYLSLGNANTDADWEKAVTWSAVPFDAGTAPNPLTIADVYIMNIPGAAGAAAVENIFVDIWQDPKDPLRRTDRYYIKPGGSPQWNLHKLSEDVAAGSIKSCLGYITVGIVPGIYTLSTIGTEEKQYLIYTPKYNAYSHQPNIPAEPTRLTPPNGARAIASALNSSGESSLFVGGTDGLFVFTPGNQRRGAVPVKVVTSDFVKGASALAAATDAKRTAVWGIGEDGDLFYVACPVGSEDDPNAWSNPVPLLPSAEGFAFFLNLQAGNNVLFAHVDGQNMVQLTQDPVTTDWHKRSILLPSTSADDIAVYKSFTTHVQVTDDNGVGEPNAAVTVTSTSPVSVYMNDVYHLLSPGVPVHTAADANGVLTIVQETDSLAAVCLQVVLTNAPEVVAKINPMSKALATLGSIKNGDDLGNVQVTNADGTKKQLVPSDLSSKDKDSVAASLVQLTQVAAKVQQDGPRQSAANGSRLTAAAVAPPRSWSVSFTSDGLNYYEGDGAARALHLPGTAPGQLLAAGVGASPLGSIGSDIAVDAGDFFRWMKHAFQVVDRITVELAGDVYHFIAHIGDEVYHVLLDSVSAVVHAVEFVFNKIKVFFEDLFKWLGFLFEWGDIVRTHKVLKNVLKQCAARAVDQIVTSEDKVKSAFDGIEKRLDGLAGVPSSTDTFGSYQSTSSSVPGFRSPQANWALHHMKGNVSSASTSYSTPDPVTDPVFDALEKLIANAIDHLTEAANLLKSQVIKPLASLTAAEAAKKIAIIITDEILTMAKDIIVTLLDIIKVAIEGIIGLLDAKITIPVLSKVYKDVAHDDLSFLDLACLIAAIPVTIIYKASTGHAPFSPDEAERLGNAKDFASLKDLLTGRTARSASAMMAVGSTDTSGDAAQDSRDLMDALAITANFTAAFGALGVAIVAPLKRIFQEQNIPPPVILRSLAAVLYFPYVAPNLVQAFQDSDRWYTKLNDAVTAASVAKTVVDNTEWFSKNTRWSSYISPIMESVINSVWFVPALGSIGDKPKPKDSDVASFQGNMSFDLGGAITFLSEEQIVKDPDTAIGAFGLIETLTLAYGVLSLVAGEALVKNN